MMKCPECNGNTTVVLPLTNDENEIYRFRKCKECGHKFYTIEFEVDRDAHFKKEWTRLTSKRTLKSRARRANKKINI